MRLIPTTCFALALLSFPVLAAEGPKPLFAADTVISLTLSGPLTSLSRSPGAKPMPGILKLEGPAPETLPVLLTTRGVTRRKKEVCSFPPLRVEFAQKPGKDSLFKGQKSLKLVTHCQDSDRFQQQLLLEYASYRLYRALTPESFNVRLANVNYVNESGRPIVTRMGFFIEDIDDVASRNGQTRLKGVGRITVGQIEPEAAARFAVFQYMISNLDWAMTLASPGDPDCCHNSRLLTAAKGAATNLITVPYDFDYGGLVDAPYAAPPENSGVYNVRTRRYRGFCSNNEPARAFAASLAPRRAALMAILDQTPQLSDRTRGRADDYMGEFFDQIATPAKMGEMLATCLR